MNVPWLEHIKRRFSAHMSFYILPRGKPVLDRSPTGFFFCNHFSPKVWVTENADFWLVPGLSVFFLKAGEKQQPVDQSNRNAQGHQHHSRRKDHGCFSRSEFKLYYRVKTKYWWAFFFNLLGLFEFVRRSVVFQKQCCVVLVCFLLKVQTQNLEKNVK